jgi:prepilin-type N-terminal cleavage/methylation domain-containing protein
MRLLRPAARPGFTLIELLVVIAIICVLAAVGYMTLPNLAGDFNRTRGIDALSEWLLSAKMRAKRDGTGTGIRLLPDPSTGLFNQVVYVQQPDPLASGQLSGKVGTVMTDPTNPKVMDFSNMDLVGPGSAPGLYDALVQPGDYLEVFGNTVRLITSVQSSTKLTLNTALSTPINPPGTSNFRILRSPRVLGGEDVKQLPGSLGINFSLSYNLPMRNVSGIPFYEILFSPAGSVIGQGTGGGKIVLYVQDTNQVQNPGQPTLIVINVRTGFIGAFPVAPGADPYLYTESGASGGL